MADTLNAVHHEQFEDTPAGNAKRWSMEFEAAKKDKDFKQWHEYGDKIEKLLRATRGLKSDGIEDMKLGLFPANIQTMRALMYGKVPGTDVSRRYADPNDTVARVSAEMLQRVLNTDIEENHDSYASALDYCLNDRLGVGMCNALVRYETEFEHEEIAAIHHPDTGEVMAEGYTQEHLVEENVCVDFIYWRDNLWSPARTFEEVRWWAFKRQMSQRQIIERFGEEVGRAVPLNSKNSDLDKDMGESPNSPWSRADVWEIWSKEDKKTYWYIEGFARTLDEKEDMLGLEHFWPFPRPMMANLTNSKFVPVPDYIFAKPLYDEIDRVTERITRLGRACKVAGVYDKTATTVGRLLNETTENALIPVENWTVFSGQGGLKGVIDWMPLDQIVAGLDKLREYRTELINLLYQVTGMSDIMRGQANQQTTATEQAIKAKFASVRVQSLQDEFARFATDIQKIKSEIISKHFQPQTIIERSNVQYTPDAQLAEQAVQLLKSHFFLYRIEVKPDSISLTDYAALKQERTEYLGALTQSLSMLPQLVQAFPGGLSYALELINWGLSGFKGSSTINGVLEQAIAKVEQMQQMQAQQPPQPPPPDPKLQAQQAKNQGDIQKTQADLQAELTKKHAEVVAENQKNMSNAHWNIVQAQGTERAKALAGVDAIIKPSPGGIS